MGGIVEPIYLLKLQVVISGICKKKSADSAKKTIVRKQIEIVLTQHKKKQGLNSCQQGSALNFNVKYNSKF